MNQALALAGNPAKERLRLWLRLLKAVRRVEAELRDNLRAEFASTLPRFDVMAALYRSRDGMRMSELSGVLMVSNGNVTGIVDRLVEEGHVIRQAVAGDRRATTVRLTDSGRALFSRMAAVHERWVDGLLCEIGAPEAARMMELLGLIADRPKRGKKK